MGPPKVSRSAEALEQSMWPLTPSPAHSSLTPPTPSQPHCELAILACGHFFSPSFPDTSICSVDAVPLAVPPQSVPTFAQPSSTHFPGLDADSPPARSPSRSPWWVVLPMCPQSAWAHPWDSKLPGGVFPSPRVVLVEGKAPLLIRVSDTLWIL